MQKGVLGAGPKCKNPKGKLWSSQLDKDCGQSVCKLKDNKGVWEQCPRPATLEQLMEVEEKILNAVKKVEEKTEQCGCQPQTTIPASEIPVPTTTFGCEAKCCVSISSKLEDGKELSWTQDFTSGSGSSSSTPTGVILTVNDDMKCNGTENNPSKGSVISSFKVMEEFKMKFDGVGAGEANYEKFWVKIDGIELFHVEASTGSLNGVPCQVSTCNMCPIQMDPVYYTFTEGSHEIEVEIDTRDGLYHKDVHFALSYTLFEDGCDDCSCVEE